MKKTNTPLQLKNKNYLLYHFRNIIYDEGQLFYIAEILKVVVIIQCSNGLVRIIHIPEKFKKMTLPFRIITKIGNELYLLPFEADVICVFNLGNNSFREINIPYDYYSQNEKPNIDGYVKNNDSCYFFGSSPVIINLNYYTQELTCNRINIDEDCRGTPIRFGKNGFILKNKLYLWSIYDNFLYEIDLDFNGINTIKMLPPKKDSLICDMLFDGRYFWLIELNGGKFKSIIRQDMGVMEARQYLIEDILEPNSIGLAFGCAIKSENILLFLPAWFDYAIAYDYENNEFNKIEIPVVFHTCLEEERGNDLNYTDAVCMNNHILTIFKHEPCIVDFDIQKMEYRTTRLMIKDKSELYELAKLQLYNASNSLIDENDLIGGLESFINVL